MKRKIRPHKVHTDVGRRLTHVHATDKTSRATRCTVLHQTLLAFDERRDELNDTAMRNLQRWASSANASRIRTDSAVVHVLPGDWGDVTRQLTQTYGRLFASLNMANAYGPGGGYVEGCAAQEENMFRRTDCHYSLELDQMDEDRQLYAPALTDLLNAEGGRVYLDTECPRVCVRGPEDFDRETLGYEWLADDQIFPFYELRAAAVDLRGGRAFDDEEMTRRVRAQFDTLVDAGVRHVVLSAFGCGAFQNPAHRVAAIYREAVETRARDFDVIAFAIFHAGYGPDNFAPFAEAFRGLAAEVSGVELSETEEVTDGALDRVDVPLQDE